MYVTLAKRTEQRTKAKQKMFDFLKKYDVAELSNYLDEVMECWAWVGSRVTCVPPPKDTDQDILCLTRDDDYFQIGYQLVAKGWVLETKEGYPDEFKSFKHALGGTVYNILLTCDTKWFDKFLEATWECKKKNLLHKSARIAEFDRVFGRKQKKSLKNYFTQAEAAAQAMQNSTTWWVDNPISPSAIHTNHTFSTGWTDSAAVWGTTLNNNF